jgi:hypothetical protein
MAFHIGRFISKYINRKVAQYLRLLWLLPIEIMSSKGPGYKISEPYTYMAHKYYGT